jgi:hypothetical protein
MHRMATQALYGRMPVGLGAEVLMARSTARSHRVSACIGETENFAGVPISIYVSLARTVTGLAALFFLLALREELLVCRIRHAGIGLVVAGLTGLTANVFIVCGLSSKTYGPGQDPGTPHRKPKGRNARARARCSQTWGPRLLR